QILGKQSGTFGSDGTPDLEGFRTVDLDSYVFLPENAKYVVEVTIENADPSVPAKTYFATTSNAITGLTGRTFLWDPEKNAWTDAAALSTDGRLVIDMGARGKHSSLANGGDFSVSWLDDGGAGGSQIYLGKADELYAADALNPDRKTLSNMTVLLESGVENVYGGTIYGEGKVIKEGAGLLRLTGASTHTGGTDISAGTLAVDGSLASQVYVASSGRLQGTGFINAPVVNDGVTAPGNSIGTLTVERYSGDGTLELEGNANGGDRLVITGSGSEIKNVRLIPAGYFKAGSTLVDVKSFVSGEADMSRLVITGAQSAGTFSSVTPVGAAGGSLFEFRGERTASYTQAALSDGGRSAGAALDTAALDAKGDAQNLVSLLDSMSLDGAGAALEQLHPEAYSVLQYAALGNNQRLSEMTARRLAGLRSLPQRGWNWYFQPFGTVARQNAWSGYGGYKDQSSGVLIGGEKESGNWIWGFHGGFLHSSAEVYGASSFSASSDGGFIGVGGKYARDAERGLFLYGLARAGWDRYTANRSVSLGSYQRAHSAEWTGFSGAAELGAGWNHKMGTAILTPVVSLNYAFIRRPGVSESSERGDGSALSLAGADYSSLRSSLGVRASFGGGRLADGTRVSVNASALWLHEFLDDGAEYAWSIAGGTARSRWRQNAGNDSLALSLGAEFEASETFRVAALLGTEVFRSGYSDVSASMRLQWNF
ncbi:MAG: autotransporter domain-containing protein, partial [Pyramidobacter sp.]|nr:autotransporter domain-containing protein [Pyramidobacter sp.]